jgi:dihydrofolate reductase
LRTLRVFESISLDGYFVDDRGDMSWAHAGGGDAEFADWVAANSSSGGELLFGRKTYEMMAGYWPTPLAAEQMPEVAKGINTAKKYVASRTIQPTWNNTQLLRADLIEAMRELKASQGPGITVLGSGSVAAQLGEAGMVDEYQFVIIPVALGAGRAVFTKSCKLQLVDHRAFRCGNVVVTYASPERVREAIAMPEGLRAWLMCTQAGTEGRVGGRIELVSGPAGYHLTGKILAWEPLRSRP